MANPTDAEYEQGMIDLGHDISATNDPMGGVPSSKTKPVSEKSYPSLSIQDIPELDNLPDGEFYFVGKGQVTRHTEDTPVDSAPQEDGCSCEITVMSMKPVGSAAESVSANGEKDSGEKLSDALDSIAQKKADAAEDVADKGIDESTEE